MIKQIKILTKALICNFGNLNVMRFTKDKKKKANSIALGFVWLLFGVMMVLYLGLIADTYIKQGLADVVPMYFVAIASLIVLIFGILKAGNVIFGREGYENLCAMPVSDTAVVISRFLSMYLGNLLLTAIVMATGMVVYGYLLKPGIGFYLLGVLGAFFMPLVPMSLSVLLGVLVTAIASRMKHKSLAATVLTLAFFFGIMFLSQNLTRMEGEITDEMLLNLSGMFSAIIGKIYPPAVWLGRAMVEGNILNAFLYFGVSTMLFLLMVVLVARSFNGIYKRLYSVTAKHDFELQTLQKSPVLLTLFKREWKHYFSCSIYVVNTVVGPIMMVALASFLLFTGKEKIDAMMQEATALPVKEMIAGIVPYVLAACAGLGSTTCVSVSLEGKEWWIAKSLPVTTKNLLDGKILMYLSMVAPFYVVAEVLTILAVQPSLADMIWMIVLPALFILFAAVFGLAANLWFPVFDWDNEGRVVKQSASMLIGGVGSMFIILLCAAPMLMMPLSMWNGIRLVTAGLLVLAIVVLYRRNNKVRLTNIG